MVPITEPAAPVRFAKNLWRQLARLATVAGLALTVTLGTATACGFDMTKPERTAIDWIVDADDLLVARPRPDNAFAYGVSQVLVGSGTDVDLPGLVSTAVRQRLATNPEDGMLFARIKGSTSGIGGGEWRMVNYVDDSFRRVLRTAVMHRDIWQHGFDETRQHYLNRLQDNPDPRIRALVIAEFDKMPYEMLRTMDIRIPAAELLADLWSRQGYPFQEIRVLLLGQVGGPAARAEVHGFIDRVADWNWAQNLGAFSAALVEIDGVQGVQKLSQRLLLDPAQPLDKLEQVILALAAINRLADQDIQDAIGLAIDDLIALRPQTGPIVARQFSAVSDWSQAAALQPLVTQGALSNMTELLTVSVYLAQAREAALAQGTNAPSDG